MSLLRRRRALAWFAPLLAAVVLLGGAWTASLVSASADQGLPSRTAAQLLADVQQARLFGLSGTIVQTSNLGLPSLPGVAGGSDSSSLTSLISGSHTLRVWLSGPDKARLAVMGTLGESDVVLNGRDLWTWSSDTKSATHRILPSMSKGSRHQGERHLPMTPQEAATQALKAIDPSTKVTTDGSGSVAGRSVYELVLQPRATRSLVGQVRIAIDGATHVPLRVQVFAKGAGTPAFEVAFSQFDPTRPAASQFRFNPPPGTKVTKQSSPQSSSESGTGWFAYSPLSSGGKAAKDSTSSAPRVVGSGWGSVLVTGGGLSATSVPAPYDQVLTSLPKVSGAWGSGRLFSGPLFSAVLTDDGRVAAGAVTPQALYDALGRR